MCLLVFALQWPSGFGVFSPPRLQFSRRRGRLFLLVSTHWWSLRLVRVLWALNSLVSAPGQLSLIDAPPTAASSRKGTGVRVLYVSPLKALGVDVENNLRAPLLGIGRTGERLGQPVPEVQQAGAPAAGYFDHHSGEPVFDVDVQGGGHSGGCGYGDNR